MKRHFGTQKPRASRRRSGVFFLSGTLISALVVITPLGCTPRAVANGPGAIPDAPVVTFESPSADTTMVRGSAIAFAVSIESRHELAAVRAEVSGALNYRFPPSTPADSVFTAVYRVQTNETTGDTVLVTVTATDVLGNRGVGRRSVSLR